MYYIVSKTGSMLKSNVTLAHDVGMRSVCLVWVLQGHGQCRGAISAGHHGRPI